MENRIVMRIGTPHVFLLLSVFCYSQNTDTIVIPTVELSDHYVQWSYTGRHIEKIDSSQLITYTHCFLSELLERESTAFIKSESPGTLSTISIRGTGSNHTGVYWKGFNINSVSLGLTDFTDIPSSFFTDMNLVFGGSGATDGSGSLGGSIHLNQSYCFQNRKSFTMGQGLGSFDFHHSYFASLLSGTKYQSSSNLVFSRSSNNYPYNDLRGQRKTLENAQYCQLQFLQDFAYRPNNREFLIFGLWYQRINRHVPTSSKNIPTEAQRNDQNIRFSGEWRYDLGRSFLEAKQAYFYTAQRFFDLVKSIDDSTHIWTSITQLNHHLILSPRLRLNYGIQHAYSKATGSTFKNPSQGQLALFAFLSHMFHKKIRIETSLRKEWLTDYDSIPLATSLSIRWILTPKVFLNGNVSYNYRIPTLNDRFFISNSASALGNSDLKAEQGWSKEIGLQNKSQDLLQWQLSVYHSLINDWISWISQNGILRPQNIKKVEIQGIETTAAYHHIIKAKTSLNLRCNYTYTQSFNKSVRDKNDASLGKQLIYVPFHKFALGLCFQKHNFYVQFQQVYNGLTYASTDNAANSVIPEYTLSHVQLGHSFPYKRFSLKATLQINNLFDREYTVTQHLPMPGRNFLISINLSYR